MLKHFPKPVVFRKTLSLMFKTAPKEFCAVMLLTIIPGLFPAAETLIWKELFTVSYNLLSGKSSFNSLIIILAAILVYKLLQSITAYINATTLLRINEMIKIKMLSKNHEKVSRIPAENYENTGLYNSIYRASNVVTSERFSRLLRFVFSLIQLTVSMVTNTLVLMTFSPWLVLLCLVSILPSAVARKIRGERYYYIQLYHTPKIRILNYLGELMTSGKSIKEMRVFGFHRYIVNKWTGVKNEIQAEEWNFTKKQGLIQIFVDMSSILGYGLGIAFSGYLLVKGRLDVGAFGAAIPAIKTVQGNFTSFLVQFGELSNGLNYIHDLVVFLDMPEIPAGDAEFDGLKNAITLRHVSYRYPQSERFALKDINLTINSGDSIAIVGENGAGKSTLAKLILGIYTPTGGELKYDDMEIRQYDLNSFYRKMSAVFQNFQKYSLTLRENIGFGDLERINDDDHIRNIIEETSLDKVYSDICDNSLDTLLGREFGGKELSGGEWQKVAIARGMMRNSDVIVLDEPTATLDPLIEAEVFNRFLQMTKGRTAIIISHRVGSARLAKRILVLKDGRIAESGTHDELIEKGGEYARLFSLQAQWYK